MSQSLVTDPLGALLPGEVLGQQELPGVVPGGLARIARSSAWLDQLAAAGRAEASAYVGRCDAIVGLLASVPETDNRSCSGFRGVIAEVGLVRSMTDRAALTLVNDACGLAVLPRLRAGLAAGRVGLPQSKVLLDELGDVDPAAAEQVLAELLPDDGDAEVGRTPHQLREWVRRRVIKLDPEHARRRRELAEREQTGVWFRVLRDGLAAAEIVGPVEDVMALMDNLQRLVEAARGSEGASPEAEAPPDPTHGQRLFRSVTSAVQQAAAAAGFPAAEVELHLELPVLVDSYVQRPGSAQPEPARIRLDPAAFAQVAAAQVAAAQTELRRTDAPASVGQATRIRATSVPTTSVPTTSVPTTSVPTTSVPTTSVPTLVGYGPIDAEHAARILHEAEQRAGRATRVRRLLMDPLTGVCAADARPVAVADVLTKPPPQPPPPTTAYVATDPQRRVVTLRDVTCTWPTCTRPATECDVDHGTPWPRGQTTIGNESPRCDRHHGLKHQDWTVHRNPDGRETWTSPRRRSYRTPPRD